jgi:NADPH:quinone reductase-like Zn-dependent oxidoreductase
MRAVALESFETAPSIRGDLAEPAAAAGQILVRVHSSSANQVDNAIAAGMLKTMVEHDFPVILGRDYAGTVEQVGRDVTGYAAGDEVYGFLLLANPTVHDGSWAELITLSPDVSIAPKPVSLDSAAAGAAPLAGLAALAAIDSLTLSKGQTVLIVGATGGVGSFAVQLAVHAGANVIAPSLPEDADYLRDLGVTDQVERNEDIVSSVREAHPDGVDALIDLVSYTPGEYDGALNAIARVSSTNGAAGDGPGRTNVMATPTPENLRRLSILFDDGTLNVHIHQTFELAEAVAALETLATSHTQGRISIQVG